MDYILTFVLLSVIGYQGFINWLDRRDARAREKDLLNRILADSFPEYVDGSKRLADSPMTAKERTEGIKLAQSMDKSDPDVLEVV